MKFRNYFQSDNIDNTLGCLGIKTITTNTLWEIISEGFKDSKDNDYHVNISESDVNRLTKLFPIEEWSDIGDNMKMIQISYSDDAYYDVILEKDGSAIVYKKIITTPIDFKEINESRPKMKHYRLRKTNHFWTLKNLDDGNLIMLKKLRINRLRVFLKDVNACDMTAPITSGMNYDVLKDELISKGEVEIYIPANRIKYMKSIYSGETSPLGNSGNYKFKGTSYDVDNINTINKKD